MEAGDLTVFSDCFERKKKKSNFAKCQQFEGKVLECLERKTSTFFSTIKYDVVGLKYCIYFKFEVLQRFYQIRYVQFQEFSNLLRVSFLFVYKNKSCAYE